MKILRGSVTMYCRRRKCLSSALKKEGKQILCESKLGVKNKNMIEDAVHGLHTHFRMRRKNK